LSQFRCSFPLKMVVIDSAGSLLPCCTFSGRKLPIGSVADDSIEGAWKSEKMTDLQNMHIENRWRDNDICRHCMLAGDNV